MASPSSISRTGSPRLPTFGIRNLLGPESSAETSRPELISITAGQYTTTLTSQPDAQLRYVDEDDGEVITLGTSFELRERLQEPVPSSVSSVPDPINGELVHVFDIKRSSGSLIEWADHEAYSSKYFRKHTASDEPESVWPATEIDLPTVPSTEPFNPATAEGSAKAKQREDVPIIEARIVPSRTAEKDEAELLADSIIGGIERHLNGLASVLQVAANTLQRAAQKTRDTDTSVVDDILAGVRGILSEVGSIGLDVLKTIDADTADDETDIETVREQSPTPDQSEEAVSDNDTTTSGAKVDSDSITSESTSSTTPEAPKSQTSESTWTDLCKPLNLANPVFTSLPSLGLQDNTSDTSRGKMPAEPRRELPILESPKSRSHSILDCDTDDLDFAARYPPLTSIRRAQTIGSSTQRYQPYSRRAANETTLTDKFGPWTSAEPLRDTSETHNRPLPGAWPDFKNDAAATLVPESSGAFFNRMTGRTRQSDEENMLGNSTIHRANTTASSNPASRLVKPFDPAEPFVTLAVPNSPPKLQNPFTDEHAINGLNSDNLSTTAQSSAVGDDELFYQPLMSTSSLYRKHADASRRADRHNQRPRHVRSVPGFRALADERRTTRHDLRHRASEVFGVAPCISITDSVLNGNVSGPSVSRSKTCTTRPAQTHCNLMPEIPAKASTTPRHSSHRAGATTQPHGYHYPTSFNPFIDSTPIASSSRPVPNYSTSDRDAYGSIRPSQDRYKFAQSQGPFGYTARPTQPPSSVVPLTLPTPRAAPPRSTRIDSNDKIDECTEKLRSLGFNTESRLWLNNISIAADGDLSEALDLIEDQRNFRNGANARHW